MSCAYPQWRIPWTEALLGNGWQRHRLADLYEKRVHNDGVIIQRPEFEMLQREYPNLASKCQQIPCGKCIQCRLAYSREWANRCIAELKTAANAIFVTLTYSTEYLKFSPYVDSSSGEVGVRPVLVPKDLQNFFKRFRAYCRDELGYNGIRFFACGEYGDKGLRPHYHAIIYNVPAKIWENSHIYRPADELPGLFTSPLLDKLWPFGMVVFGDVNWSTCAYVSRYVVKKRKGEDRKAQRVAQEMIFPGQPWQDEFVRMSRRPGIGREYYEAHKDQMYNDDAMYVNVNGKMQAVKPAKYYDKLYDVEHHRKLKQIKLKRSKAGVLSLASELSKTDLSEEEYLIVKLESKMQQAKKLIRPLED